jgi:hypothetical protein
MVVMVKNGDMKSEEFITLFLYLRTTGFTGVLSSMDLVIKVQQDCS